MLPRDTWSSFVDGGFVETDGGEVIDVADPATGESIAAVRSGDADVIDQAVAAAREAFPGWRETGSLERRTVLLEIADRVEDRHDEFVELETAENGKPLPQSENDVTNTQDMFRFYAGTVDKYFGDTVQDSAEEVVKTIREPYGVVGIIIPYNWPPIHTADFVAPALAAGNAVVLKPSPETPLSSLRIAELAADLLPDGVLNVVPGGGETGAALTSHADVDMVAFTGSDETGERVLEATARHITPTMMELGGKNPAMVFPDADVEKTVSGLIYNTFYNSGQACSNPERWLLHEAVRDEVVERAAERVSEIRVGDGRESGVEVGPVISDAQLEKFETAIERATDEGAEVLARAETPTDPRLSEGHWAPPTLLGGVTPEMDVARKEVFGPVGLVITFEDEAEALEIANGVEYGLGAAIWTRDVNRSHRIAHELDAGIITVNHPIRGRQGVPFGGFKRSGIGKKRGFEETLDAYTRTKSLQMDLTDRHFPLSYGNQ